MKVAIIGHKQIPGRAGGVEVVVEELATRLAARGVEAVAYNRNDKTQPSLEMFAGVRLVDVPTPNSKQLNAGNLQLPGYRTCHCYWRGLDPLPCSWPRSFTLAGKVIWKKGCSNRAWT